MVHLCISHVFLLAIVAIETEHAQVNVGFLNKGYMVDFCGVNVLLSFFPYVPFLVTVISDNAQIKFLKRAYLLNLLNFYGVYGHVQCGGLSSFHLD